MQERPSLWPLFSRGLGLVLLLAALLKAGGGDYSPVVADQRWLPAGLHIGLIAWEFFLGGWLLWGGQVTLSWWATLGTFASFSLVSGWATFQGLPSCGCLGPVVVPPAYILSFDVVALGVILWTRPHLSAGNLDFYSPLAGVLMVGAVGFSSIHLAFGSTEALLAWIRGADIVLTPQSIDAGTGENAVPFATTISIHNWRDRPIVIRGASNHCTLRMVESMPVTISPGTTQTLHLEARYPSEPNQMAVYRLRMWIDDGERQRTEVIAVKVHSSANSP
jgi:hypothetical protein